jgi:hypothetical protein
MKTMMTTSAKQLLCRKLIRQPTKSLPSSSEMSVWVCVFCVLVRFEVPGDGNNLDCGPTHQDITPGPVYRWSTLLGNLVRNSEQCMEHKRWIQEGLWKMSDNSVACIGLAFGI